MSNLPPRTGNLLPGEKYKDHSNDIYDAEIIAVGDGEYLEVSTSGGWLAATWSSALTVHEFLEVIGKKDNLTAPTDGRDSFISFHDPEEGQVQADGAASDVVQCITEEKPDVRYVRLDYEGVSLIWMSPRKRIAWSDVEVAEVGIATPVESETDQLQELLLQSATPTVKDNQQTLFSRMKQLQ